MNDQKYTIRQVFYISLWDTMDGKSSHDGIKNLETEYVELVSKFCTGKCVSADVTSTVNIDDYGVEVTLTRPMTVEEVLLEDKRTEVNDAKQELRDRKTFEELQKKYGW